ncbi:MAG TPA: FliH/SctL family protein [Candidatus Rubrimentiphilum sp.]|nr:FliH/SctL family protein [Candidatus Rubrimentiphilum sp.]
MADLLRPKQESSCPSETVGEPKSQPQPDEVAASRELRLFHARLREAVENAARILCQDIAAEVVARELQLAPAQISNIIARALARYEKEDPVCVRVHADDVGLVSAPIPIVSDAQLRRGDAILELRDGFVDVSLGVRLESVLAAL